MLIVYFSSLLLSSRFFSLPPSRNSDPVSHSSSPPFPPTVRVLHFYREKTSALSSLVDSRRIVPTHAIIGALDNWCHLRKKKLHTEIATYGINAGGVRG